MTKWLIDPAVADEIQAAARAVGQLSEEQKEAFLRELSDDHKAALDGNPRNLRIVGTVAEIRVEGVLTPKPSLFALLFGGRSTTFEQIRSALAVAAKDENVKSARLVVNSPGGTVEGLFETIDALKSFPKSMSVLASRAASGAFGLASAAGPIAAVGPGSEFGSVGVVQTFLVLPELVSVTSTNAPNKRPDVTTEDGRAAVRDELDDIHDLFVGAIAEGRSAFSGRRVSTADVNENFGRGGMLVASRARAAGMIDELPEPVRRVRRRAAEENEPEPDSPGQPDAAGGGEEETHPMTKEELKRMHPEVAAALVDEGVEKERKRCVAHMTLGESSGAMDVAKEAIASGASTLDEEVHASYLSAHMNRRDDEARQAETDDASKDAAGADGDETESEDMGDKVVALMKARKKGAA